MRRTDYRKFKDRSLLDRLGGLGQGLSLLLNPGIYQGDYLVKWLDRQLATHAPGTVTFGDLPPVGGRSTRAGDSSRLVVIVSDVSSGRLVRLPWDYQPRYGLDPDIQPISAAVRASASIPFFFEPYQLTHGDGRTRSCLVDGGMLSNFPIEVFDRPAGKRPRWPTFGIKLSARPGAEAVPRNIRNPFDLLNGILTTLTSFHDGAHVDRPDVAARTIFIDTSDISAIDFDLSPERSERLFESGRQAAKEFLATWDFDEYRRRHRSGLATSWD